MRKDRKLCVFLCHASQDRPAVRELYGQLKGEGWIDPWLDEEKPYPGRIGTWRSKKQVEAADEVAVSLCTAGYSP